MIRKPIARLREWVLPKGAGRPDTPPAGGGPPGAHAENALAEEQVLIAALRDGDEATFAALVERYHGALLRLARLHVSDPAVAEEVVQETWLGVLQGIDRFEGRSSLKTWLFRILVNCAKTRGQRESRSVPFSALLTEADQQDEPAIDPPRFQPGGYWQTPPRSWAGEPEERLLAAETRRTLEAAIATLPPVQQQVLVLRDVEGWAAAEVCNALAISESNQRVLLHRGRSRVRRALEGYIDQDGEDKADVEGPESRRRR